MVNFLDESVAATFAVLGDPTRRAILKRRTQGDASVTELARPFAVSLPDISKQLHMLERARIAHPQFISNLVDQ